MGRGEEEEGAEGSLEKGEVYKEGRQGTYATAGSSVAFCFVALPRDTFSLPLFVSLILSAQRA